MASSPYYSFSSVTVIFVFALLFAVTSTSEVVDAAEKPVDPSFPICKTIIGAGNQSFDMNFCMEALNSDNRAQYADNRTQYADDYQKSAIVVVNLLTANATSTAAQIGNLLEKESNVEGPMKWCLQSCRALYGSILQMQPRCWHLVEDFRYHEAKSCLDQAARETELCEAEFVGRHVVSALAVENDCAFKLARLASALVDHA